MKKTIFLISFLTVTTFFNIIKSNVSSSSSKDETERPRRVLIEAFSSSTCGPCVEGNQKLKRILAENEGLYSLIKYQMNWPSSGDPYFTREGEVRKDFYNVQGVPSLILDGVYYNSLTFQHSHLLELQNIPSYMDLNVEYSVTGKTVNATATITPSIDFENSNLVLFMAIVERRTVKNKGANGENEFLQVMKKFMPDANGIEISSLTANVPATFQQEWEFKGEYRLPINGQFPINHDIEHSVENFDNLTVVAWVQNISNKSILQAWSHNMFYVGFSSEGDGGTIIAEVDGNQIESHSYFEPGTAVTLTATPNDYSEIAAWKINGEIVPDFVENELIHTVGLSHKEIIVQFKRTHYNVKFSTVNQFGELSATANGENIEAGEYVDTGAQIVFTATPIEGYAIRLWRNNGTAVTGNTTNEYIISSLDKDINITVEFQSTHLTVNYSVINDFGALTATVDDEEIESGESVLRWSRVVFTATPNEGHEIKEWRNNGNLIQGNVTNQYVIAALNNNVNITVEFTDNSGINSNSLQDIKLYPNPFTNEIKISNPELVKNVEIINITGQKVKDVVYVGKSINTENFNKGIYFVIVESLTGEKVVNKMVKR